MHVLISIAKTIELHDSYLISSYYFFAAHQRDLADEQCQGVRQQPTNTAMLTGGVTYYYLQFTIWMQVLTTGCFLFYQLNIGAASEHLQISQLLLWIWDNKLIFCHILFYMPIFVSLSRHHRRFFFKSSYSLVNLQAYRGDIMLVRTLYFFFLRFRHLRAKLSKLKIGPQRPSY